ncbi:Ulp1 family isopeptidase [Sinorhizobium meliloti]|uniref:Ulp1 family isopeptidase n=1 Tax=Rhizobium meliloti TaxID=382 RepID=UPI0004146FE2|nr:Ulp1 family isopeptidase [Sinorhizobium meliloti]ARS65977.1 hypothetical protein SMRU11_00610 [Sinorhizobium meliloti RU11/001]
MGSTGGESSDSSPEQNSEADTWIADLQGEDVASSRWSRHSTASQEEPITRQPKKEKKGWFTKGFAKVKDGVKKLVVPSSGKKSSKDWTPEPEAIAQQLSDLHLDSGAIRRTSMGGSMRMPAQPSLRDNNSSARHSTDASYGYETTFHLHHAKAVTPAATTADENLIEAAAAAYRHSDYSESTIKDNLTYLRALSNELKSLGGLAQLSDEQLGVYVDTTYPRKKKECSSRRKNYRAALRMLENYRKAGDGVKRKRGAPRRVASPEDEALINEASEYGVARGGYTQTTVNIYARSLRRLSDELRSDKQTITGLQDAALRGWVAKLGLDSNSMQGGLLMLELYRQFQRANNSQDAGGSFQRFQGQHVTPQSEIGPSSGAAFAPYSNTSGWYADSQQNQQAGPHQNLGEEWATGIFGSNLYPSNAYAASSNPPQIDPSADDPQQNWHEQEIIKQFGSPFTPDYDSTQNELPPPPADNNPRFVPNPRWTPANLPDLGDAVEDWQHGRQVAPDALTNALRYLGLMPAPNLQTRFLINQELYTANLHWDGSVFLIQQTGAWLGDEDWVYDQHIARDFNLLSRELQRNNPALAARTRLATPAMVQYLRMYPDAEITSMFSNEYGVDDAADYVFIPVSNIQGAEADGGTHWSLLLLFRSDRSLRPAAAHFDSSNHANMDSARQIAGIMGVTAGVTPVKTSQQGNGRDCGVYLLEAARALIEQLAQGQQMDTSNLPGDRGALQARLRQPQGDNI